MVSTLTLLVFPVFSQEPARSYSENPLGHQYFSKFGILDISRAQAPYFAFGDTRILFSYQANPGTGKGNIQAAVRTSTPRHVALAFAHENYAVQHTFSKNSFGVFYYMWDLQRDIQVKLGRSGNKLVYRLIVDGVWMADPVNELKESRVNGSVLSYVDLASAPSLPLLSPEFGASVGKTTSVTLRVRAAPGAEVFVAGTFNNFEPYLHVMQESFSDQGLYSIDLRLLKGQYFYYFVVNGESVLDSLNPVRGRSPEGRQYSRFIIE